MLTLKVFAIKVLPQNASSFFPHLIIFLFSHSPQPQPPPPPLSFPHPTSRTQELCLHGRQLDVSMALSKQEMERLRKHKSSKREKMDKRNLHLAKEGGRWSTIVLWQILDNTASKFAPQIPSAALPSSFLYAVILPDSEAAKDLSKADLTKRMKV